MFNGLFFAALKRRLLIESIGATLFFDVISFRKFLLDVLNFQEISPTFV